MLVKIKDLNTQVEVISSHLTEVTSEAIGRAITKHYGARRAFMQMSSVDSRFGQIVRIRRGRVYEPIALVQIEVIYEV